MMYIVHLLGFIRIHDVDMARSRCPSEGVNIILPSFILFNVPDYHGDLVEH